MSEITVPLNEDYIDSQELPNLIEKSKNEFRQPIIKFTTVDFPQEPRELFEQFKYEYLNYKKLRIIVKKFETQWDAIKSQLEEFEQGVADITITQDAILEVIDKYIDSETGKQNNILTLIGSMHETAQIISQETFHGELQEINNVFSSYIEVLKSKRNGIAEKSDADYMNAVLDETKLNKEWLISQEEAAGTELKRIIDIHISTIVTETTTDMTYTCKKIDIKIEELEEKLRKKKLEIAEMRFRELKAKLSEEIATLRSRKSYLDLQIKSLLHLENSLRDLNEKLQREMQEMEDTEDFFTNEIQKALTDHQMDSAYQIKHIQKLKEAYEKAMEAHRVNIRKIEEEREVIKKAILDEFNIAMSKKKAYYVDDEGRYYIDEAGNKVYEEVDLAAFAEDMEFDYDEYGKYFIDNQGRRIYKENEESSAFVRDEFGNFIEIFSPKMSGFKAHVKLNNCEYLKSVLGDPLTKALAQVVLYQPSDPILYLAHWLLKYRKNIDDNHRREDERSALEAERERLAFEKGTHSSTSRKRLTSPRLYFLWKGGESHLDYNLMTYITPQDFVKPSLDTPQTI